MSSVVIAGDTSGSITLSAPAVAGTTTLTLPATSGTVLTQNPSAPADSLVVDASGNVGIGTASPASKLDVAGSVAIKTNDAFYSGTSVAGSSIRVLGLAADDNVYVGSVDSLTGSNTIFRTNGTERMRINSGGGISIGTTTASSSNGILLPNNGTLNTNGGTLFSTSIANSTTGSGANMFVNSTNGAIQRSTSSIKYKTNVQNSTHGLLDVMKLRSVTYKGINDGETIFGGLIAEEVHESGLTEFVQYAEDGSPDALAYGQMVALAFKAIQELNAKVEAQAEQIKALQGAV
jgi:hypothetical protein